MTMNVFAPCPWDLPGVDGTALIYDIALAPLELAGLARLRQGLISEARGAVLEIGAILVMPPSTPHVRPVEFKAI